MAAKIGVFERLFSKYGGVLRHLVNFSYILFLTPPFMSRTEGVEKRIKTAAHMKKKQKNLKGNAYYAG